MMIRRTLFVSLFSLAAVVFVLSGLAQEPAAQKDPYESKIAKPSRDGEIAIKAFNYPKDIQVELSAAEPLLANPIAFCFDEKGRIFVAETFRLHAGVTDNRGHSNWLVDELAARTVADRIAMYRKYLKKKFDSYGVEHDRVRMLVDTDGDGKYDKATVFADGFNRPEDGLGSGVLAKNGKVWYSCIPDLWFLEDKDGDGKAEVKKSLQTGYGVHVSFLGHDSHGLRFGPDGKLYFTVGDRGMHVVKDGKVVSSHDTGAVLRCNPDGTELEIVAYGLRNPQELAFDEFGNLFTGDNNADSGDQARWVYLVEGGDSGWRIGYQYLKSPPASLGPWNAEKMWHLQHPGQPAYILPPLKHISSGPSGLTYHPGVNLLPDRYKGHFFLCDFRGGPNNSGIHTFQVKPKGASFEVINQDKLISNVLVTDADFGPDGGLYLSDWVNGWGMPMKGRIYKMFDPDQLKNPKVAEVKKLLAEGMEKRSLAELAKLLEHEDQRVRQEAQFELAGRNAEEILGNAALKSKNLLARLHGLWGLGQIGRKGKYPEKALLAKWFFLPALKDQSPEIRAQAAKVLGEIKYVSALEFLLPLLKDDSPRVRFFAAMSVGKLGGAAATNRELKDSEAVGPILELLRDNADQDLYLRHAGVMALTWIGDHKALTAHARDNSTAARMGVLLAMRRLEMPEIAMFLNDSESSLVLEAARAINDVPIEKAMPQLAAAATRTGMPETFTYRALNAHFRLGQKENALALAQYAARPNVPEAMRLEALKFLGSWANPSPLDRVVGLWRPLKPRPKEIAAEAVKASLGGIMSGTNKVREEAVKVASRLGITEIGPALFELIGDKDRPASVRVASLKGLESLKDKRLETAMNLALNDADPLVRAEGLRVLAQLQPEQALPRLEKTLANGSVIEQQKGFAVLGEIKSPQGDKLLSNWLDHLLAGKVRPEVKLDLLEAAALRKNGEIKSKLAKYDKARPKGLEIAPYLESLSGGDAETGKRIFLEKSEVSCLRCHKVNGTGGDVGPDLSKVAKEQKREYLMEAIVAPSKHIAKGYESVTLALSNGQFKSGILKSEDGKNVHLMTPEGTMISVPVNQIDERLKGKSAMPEDLIHKLSKSELRDLVEFLSSLR